MITVFVIGMVSTSLLLGLLALITTLIGQRLPQIAAAVAVGVSESRSHPAVLRYAA